MTRQPVGRLPLDMGGVPPGTRLLHNLSGGLDSAYQAWRLLDAGYPLLIHHCEYRTTQLRWPHENEACEKILAWLTERGLTDFEYKTTTFDRGTAARYSSADIIVLNYISGLVLGNPAHADIKHVVSGHHANSPSPHRPAAKRCREAAEVPAGRRIRWLFPILKHPKAAIIADMPRDLFDISWWCRKPVDGKPCGDQCPACRRVARST